MEKTSHPKIIPIISWALYDLANQFFALNVVSLYFVLWITTDKGVPEFFYGVTFAISILFVVILSPILGTVSDIQRRHRFFLIWFTIVSIAFTAGLGFINNIVLILVFFAIANLGCQGAVVFYNALLAAIAPPGRVGFVSGLGRMCGYTGAIIALVITKPIVVRYGYQATFFPTAVLFFIFALPCMLFVKQKSTARLEMRRYFNTLEIKNVFIRLRNTFSEGRGSKNLLNFFKAAFLVMSVANVIILFMSVYVTKVFGLNDAQVIDLVVFSTLFAMGGSILSGSISDFFGYKRTFLGVLVLWSFCLILGAFCEPPLHWLIGALGGACLGATWTVSRALIVKLIPADQIGKVFGLFNMLAAILGPAYWGVISLFFAHFGTLGYRAALLSLVIFIAMAFVFIRRIPQEAIKRIHSY